MVPARPCRWGILLSPGTYVYRTRAGNEFLRYRLPNIFTLRTSSLFIFFCFAFAAFGQTDEYLIYKKQDYPQNKYTIKNDTFYFHRVKIVIIQVKLNNEGDYDPYSAYCRIWLTVIKQNELKESIFYNDCEALGGCSGIFVSPEQPIKNYFILSKFGDYDGRIILIDTLGSMVSYRGGQYFFSLDKRYLFSIYNSDLAGLTVFDLIQKKLLYSSDTLGIYLDDLYSIDNEYFMTVFTDDNTDEKIQIATYDFRKNRLVNEIVDKRFIARSRKLKGYHDFTFGPCNCGRIKDEK